MSPPRLPRLVLRADGNPAIGLGHVMRLLALAEVLHGAFADCLLVSRDAAALAPLLATAGLPALTTLPLPALPPEAEATWLKANALRPTDVLVLDGYDFGLAYQQALRPAVGRLVYVDDLRAWPVVADVLINHSPGIEPADYELLNPAATLLLGPAFSLVRPPFRAAAAPPRPPRPIRRVLLCFGGADPLRLTARCLGLLRELAELREIGVLAGAANPDGPALRQQLAAHPDGRCVFHAPTDAAGLVQLLARYDAVLCPASTILIEALLLGLPALTGHYAANQQPLADFVAAHGQAYSVGNFAALGDTGLQAELSAGLAHLGHAARQPYAPPLRPDALRASIAAPLPCRAD